MLFTKNHLILMKLINMYKDIHLSHPRRLILRTQFKQRLLYPLISLLFYLPITGHASTDSNLSHLFVVDCKVSQAHGLHSYYLFTQQPVFNAHTDALEQTEFILRKISRIKERYKNTPIEKQHTFYIPVSFEPQSWVQDPQEDDFAAAARWVLHNYDHQCAKKLLQPFPSINKGGTYILSSKSQLVPAQPSNASPNNGTKLSGHPLWRIPVLVQDLSDSLSVKSNFWFETFLKKSWQPRQWETTNLLQLHESMLEALFEYDTQPQDGRLNQQEKQSHPEMNTGFIPVIPQPLKFNTCADYPVNDIMPTQPNPYTDKITIQYRQPNTIN